MGEHKYFKWIGKMEIRKIYYNDPKLEKKIKRYKIGIKVLSLVLIIFILLIVGAYKIGKEYTEKKLYCADDVCGIGGYFAYYYDDINDICNCWEDDKIVYRESLKKDDK